MPFLLLRQTNVFCPNYCACVCWKRTYFILFYHILHVGQAALVHYVINHDKWSGATSKHNPFPLTWYSVPRNTLYYEIPPETLVDVWDKMGVFENSVPLNPMVNDHYPYYMAIIGNILYFQTNPNHNKSHIWDHPMRMFNIGRWNQGTTIFHSPAPMTLRGLHLISIYLGGRWSILWFHDFQHVLSVCVVVFFRNFIIYFITAGVQRGWKPLEVGRRVPQPAPLGGPGRGQSQPGAADAALRWRHVRGGANAATKWWAARHASARTDVARWVPKSWGIPNSINGWMVYFMENPIEYIDENWGYPPFYETSRWRRGLTCFDHELVDKIMI